VVEVVIFLVFFTLAGSVIGVFYLLGRRALAIFPDMNSVNIVFREKYATGYSNNSIITKVGGANGVLDVVLTSEELWLKTGFFFASIAKMYKVLHNINRDNITKVQKVSNKKVVIHFAEETGNEKSVTLKLSNLDEFIELLVIN
jgi:hypothetical protein